MVASTQARMTSKVLNVRFRLSLLKHLKNRDTMLANRRLKMHEIVEAMGILHASVVSTFYDHLANRKLSARWVPRMLMIVYKGDGV